MTTSPSRAVPSPSLSSGASPSSLPRWRSWLSTLNWRRDPDYERRVLLSEQLIWQSEQLISQSEQRMKQIDARTRQIESEIAQLRQENARLAKLNAWDQALDASIRRLCFPPDSSLTPPTPTEPDSKPCSP